MSSSGNSDSISSVGDSRETDLKSTILENLMEPICKGLVCGVAHIAVFTILKRMFLGKKLSTE